MVRADEAVDVVEEAVQEGPTALILLDGNITRFLAGLRRILSFCNFFALARHCHISKFYNITIVM
jgi:hypothetical protein